MRTSLVIGLAVFLILIALVFSLCITYIAYWLMLKAGAEQWVAMLTGIVVWIAGWAFTSSAAQHS